MSSEEQHPWASSEDLFEEAPCGYIATDPDGMIVKVNRTFERWTGLRREELVSNRRFQELMSPGGRIYHDTHYSPLLHMQGEVRGISVEIVRADGSHLPALINSVLSRSDDGAPRMIRTTVFDASDRRAYEQELRTARRREHEIADQLQRSLLSGELPSAAGFDVTVSYRPGVSGLRVGGDWYDAFWLEEPDTVALVVGDVVGRGLEAAASMGQLRSAVRALASTGLRPAALLEALDRYSDRHGVGQMATLIYAQLSLTSGSFSFACAGHPPPLVIPPDERPCFNWQGRSLPLNTHLGDGHRRGSSIQLSAGSTVLLYTDGLVDRPGSPADDGMNRLLATAAEHRDDDSPLGRASTIVRALHDAEHTDDVCLLVARVRIGS